MKKLEAIFAFLAPWIFTHRLLFAMIPLMLICVQSGGNTADFDGDGNHDLLFHNTATRKLEVWFMNQSAFDESKPIRDSGGNPVLAPLNWKIVGTGYFWMNSSNPRRFGILWQDQISRALAVWYLTGADNTQYESSALLPNASPGWQALAVGDFDGDGHSDVAFQRDTSGYKGIWLLETNSLNIKPNGIGVYEQSNPQPKWRIDPSLRD